MLRVKEVKGIYKIWIGKDWAYLCELVGEKYKDLEYNTYEEAERAIEQIKDHQATINGELDWNEYCAKWNIVEE